MPAAIQVSEDVLFRQLEGEAVLLDLTSQRYFGLDSTATYIWSLLKDGRDRTEILDGLLAEFEVDRSRAEQDLDEFLQELEGAGLLRRSVPAAPETVEARG